MLNHSLSEKYNKDYYNWRKILIEKGSTAFV